MPFERKLDIACFRKLGGQPILFIANFTLSGDQRRIRDTCKVDRGPLGLRSSSTRTIVCNLIDLISRISILHFYTPLYVGKLAFNSTPQPSALSHSYSRIILGMDFLILAERSGEVRSLAFLGCWPRCVEFRNPLTFFLCHLSFREKKGVDVFSESSCNHQKNV